MPTYKFDDNSCFILPDASEIKNKTIEWWKEATQTTFTPDESSIEGRIIDAEAISRLESSHLVCSIANQINPDLASSIYLDSLCSLIGVKRKPAEYSRVECMLTGANGTTVPANSEIEDSNGNLWISREDILILGDGSMGTFYCEKVGNILADPNTITKIKKGTLGWSGVTNPKSAISGRLEETDDELRNSRRLQISMNGHSTLLSINSAIQSLDGVKKVKLYENNTNQDQILGDITVTPKSVYLCVDGGDNEQIASEYMRTKSAGCGFSASPKPSQAQNNPTKANYTEVDYIDPVSGQLIKVIFDRPIYKDLAVRITIKITDHSSVSADVKNVMYQYSQLDTEIGNGFTMGTDTSPFEIASYINKNLPDIFITKVELAKVGEAYSTDTIKNEFYEKCKLNESNIEVVVIR